VQIRDLIEIDFALILSALVLTAFGVLFIYSSGVTSAGLVVSTEYLRQIVWGLIGLAAALLLALADYQKIPRISLYLYLGALALLVYTCLFGRLVNGARAWIGIGTVGVQPSEFAKITTILFLGRYLADTKRSASQFNRFAISCLIVFAPMGLVLIQPDFGTSLVFIPILLVMTFAAGVAIRYVIFLIAVIAITGFLMALPLWQTYINRRPMDALSALLSFRFNAAAISVFLVIGIVAFLGYRKFKRRYFYWILYGAAIGALSLGAAFLSHKVLKDYQIMRLIVFMNPNVDPRGAGWNIIQSITAIGSGGLFGKGFLQGTQSHYRFLPQQSTDFIFSIYTEEWGFAGGILVFALFLTIILRLVRIMKKTIDPFGAYLCAGLAGMLAFHFLINVGMTMGIMPITGIPLTFMSYGGSSLISAMAGLGIASSVHIRRYRR
jgi:rod shape determining protein RodA